MAKTSKCAILKIAIKWRERYCMVTCISYVSREVLGGKKAMKNMLKYYHKSLVPLPAFFFVQQKRNCIISQDLN